MTVWRKIMAKKYTPAIFQPTLRPSWGGVMSYITVEEKAKIFEAIINYPKDTHIVSKFWEETVKPDLDVQYDKFVSSCLAKGVGARNYWETKDMDKGNISLPYDIDKDNISLPNVNHKDNSLKDKDKDKGKSNIYNNNINNNLNNNNLNNNNLKNINNLNISPREEQEEYFKIEW